MPGLPRAGPAVSPRSDTEWGTLERFQQDSAGHVMTVALDQGLYRHLKFRHPGRLFYWFDIVTWPGYLTITGDMGTYTFTRTPDMFEFFGTGPINPMYWAEKLTRPGDSVTTFSQTALDEVVTEHFDDWALELPETEAGRLLKALRDALLRPDLSDTREAHEALATFQWTSHTGKVYGFSDSWEFDLTEYTVQFLWCLHAITYAIRQYRALQPAAVAP